MGLVAEIFKNPLFKKCSNGGISETYDMVTVVNVDGPSKPSADAPAVLLVAGNAPGTVKVVPAVPNPERLYEYIQAPGWVMAGGSFVETCDSRFHQAVERLTGAPFYGAVSFHDRYE